MIRIRFPQICASHFAGSRPAMTRLALASALDSRRVVQFTAFDADSASSHQPTRLVAHRRFPNSLNSHSATHRQHPNPHSV